MDIVLYVATAFLYGVLSFFAWRTYSVRAAHPLSVSSIHHVSKNHRQLPVWTSRLLFLTLILHGYLLHLTVFPKNGVLFGFAFALSAMLWLACCIYWVESFFWPLQAMTILIFPLALLSCLLPLFFGGTNVFSFAASPFFKLHFVIANIAYGLFVMTALHAVLMLLAERYLHVTVRQTVARNWMSAWLDMLPPLLTLEHLLFRLLYVGFVFLTITLLTGLFFQEQMNIQALSNHKNIYALSAWLMVLILLFMRKVYGWRGRIVARWVLVIFVVLLLAYVGSRFFRQMFFV